MIRGLGPFRRRQANRRIRFEFTYAQAEELLWWADFEGGEILRKAMDAAADDGLGRVNTTRLREDIPADLPVPVTLTRRRAARLWFSVLQARAFPPGRAACEQLQAALDVLERLEHKRRKQEAE